MDTYLVQIDGCDDTNVFRFEMTPEQHAFLESVADASKEASSCGCEPIISSITKEA